MLSARQLEIRRGPCPVLTGIDLDLQPGELLGVLGPNGAGKSSLLAALCGELAPAAGSLLLDGRPLADWPALARAQRLAVLPQASSLEFAFRVREVVELGRLPHASGQSADAAIVQQALAAADISHLAERHYTLLSGGERQRVHLARVLAQLWPGAPGQVLLLDEPTSQLDPLHQQLILQAVSSLAARGVAVLVILHDLNLAARWCQRLLLLAGGRCAGYGPTADILQPELLRQVFGIDLLVQRHPERDHPLIVVR